jgi:hypothetical protein
MGRSFPATTLRRHVAQSAVLPQTDPKVKYLYTAGEKSDYILGRDRFLGDVPSQIFFLIFS